jgi:hypothetical protein
VELIEVKKLLEQQGQAFEEFKTANDALIKAMAEGKAVADLEAKVAKLSDALDGFADVTAFDYMVPALMPPWAAHIGVEAAVELE